MARDTLYSKKSLYAGVDGIKNGMQVKLGTEVNTLVPTVAGEKAIGVVFSAGSSKKGDAVSIVTFSGEFVDVLVGSVAVPFGSEVTSDAQGKAKVATAGDKINGIAVSDGAINGLVEINFRG